MKRILYMCCMVCHAYFLSSCSKDFLEVKQDVAIRSPETLDDLQSMMDAAARLNLAGAHTLGFIGSDDFVVANDNAWISYQTISPYQYRAYIWDDMIFTYQDDSDDWNNGYTRILYTNMVLDGLRNIVRGPDNQELWDNVYGAAKFFRAMSYYQLAQLFCPVHDADNAQETLGLPLRLEADVTLKSRRSSVKETYGLILQDFEDALNHLPADVPTKLRPSRSAAEAFLARVYLQLEDYEKALYFAGKVLEHTDVLKDYNTLDSKRTYPFLADYGVSNPEVIFFAVASAMPLLQRARMQISDDLLSLYETDDLRGSVYYLPGTVKNIYYRGSQSGGLSFFVAPTIAEMYLIRAEAYARKNQMQDAIDDLNTLRTSRFVNNTYRILTVADVPDVLSTVLKERRMEMAFHGVRWEDLRRLNKDSRFAKTVIRTVNGKTYSLPPNDPRYVWPIPQNVVDISAINQNSR